jgi:hypothetical protein
MSQFSYRIMLKEKHHVQNYGTFGFAQLTFVQIVNSILAMMAKTAVIMNMNA